MPPPAWRRAAMSSLNIAGSTPEEPYTDVEEMSTNRLTVAARRQAAITCIEPMMLDSLTAARPPGAKSVWCRPAWTTVSMSASRRIPCRRGDWGSRRTNSASRMRLRCCGDGLTESIASTRSTESLRNSMPTRCAPRYRLPPTTAMARADRLVGASVFTQLSLAAGPVPHVRSRHAAGFDARSDSRARRWRLARPAGRARRRGEERLRESRAAARARRHGEERLR